MMCGRCCLGFHGYNLPENPEYPVGLADCTCECHGLSEEERKALQEDEY